jgi:hypothetical protein
MRNLFILSAEYSFVRIISWETSQLGASKGSGLVEYICFAFTLLGTWVKRNTQNNIGRCSVKVLNEIYYKRIPFKFIPHRSNILTTKGRPNSDLITLLLLQNCSDPNTLKYELSNKIFRVPNLNNFVVCFNDNCIQRPCDMLFAFIKISYRHMYTRLIIKCPCDTNRNNRRIDTILEE